MIGRRLLSLLIVAAPLAFAPAQGADDPGRALGPIGGPDEVGGYASDRVIVRFKPVTADAARVHAEAQRQRRDRGLIGAADREPPLAFSTGLKNTWRQWGVSGIHRFASGDFANPAAAANLGLDRTYILEVPARTNVPMVSALLAAFANEVEWAEPDGIGAVAEVIPNDSFFSYQYALRNTGGTGRVADADIDASDAWDLHTGGLGTVTIAIVDTGVSAVTEFTGRLLTGINTVGNGAPTTDTDDICDLGGPTGHGTHVAGIAAAAGNNNLGVAGVTWGANILPVKVFGLCSGVASDTAEGITWAVDNGADILNISLQFAAVCAGGSRPGQSCQADADCPGGSCARTTLQTAVDYATDNGALVVAAAGNTGFSCGPAPATVCYPAKFPNVIAVSATNDDDVRANVSRYGPEVDVCAPGDTIISSFRNGTFGYLSGTSMASPHVAGLAALVKSYNCALTAAELRAILETTADDLLTAGFDDQTGNGRINAHSALLAVSRTPTITGSAPPDGAIDARQPSEPDGSDPAGWQFVDLVVCGDTSGLDTSSFTVTQEGGTGTAPTVLGFIPQGGDVFRVILSNRIAVEAWTTIECIPCGSSIRLGFLPGDVTGDGTNSVDDVQAMIETINGFVAGSLADWSFDIDRNERLTPTDVIRHADLFNGGDVYPPYLGASLP